MDPVQNQEQKADSKNIKNAEMSEEEKYQMALKIKEEKKLKRIEGRLIEKCLSEVSRMSQIPDQFSISRMREAADDHASPLNSQDNRIPN